MAQDSQKPPREHRPEQAGPEPAEVEAASPTREPLRVNPPVEVRRLNRLGIFLIIALAISVLWTTFFVLSGSQQRRQEPARLKAYVPNDQLRLQRLEREALRSTIAPPPASVWRPTRTQAGRAQAQPLAAPEHRGQAPARQGHDRLRRARDAQLMVAGFESPALAPARGSAETDPWTRAKRSAGTRGAQGQASPSAAADPHRSSLDQARDRPPTQAINPTRRSAPSPFTLQEGALIPAILAQGLRSDLPGQAFALVRRDVFDSNTGRHLLIPRGSRIVGHYDHQVLAGQRRLLVVWHRLHLPDGSSLDLPGLPGADLAARAGFQDRRRGPFLRALGRAVLLTAFSAGAQLSQPQESSTGLAPSSRQIAAAALGQEISQVGTETLRRSLDLKPRLEIRPGYPFHLEVTHDIAFASPYRPAGKTTGSWP